MHYYPQGQQRAIGYSRHKSRGTWLGLSFDDGHFDDSIGADVVDLIGLSTVDVDQFDFSIFCSQKYKFRVQD